MPRFLTPGKTFPVWLDSDAHLPIDQRPAFLACTLNGHQEEQLLDMQNLIDVTRAATVREAMLKAMLFIFIGWKNMGGEPFSPEGVRKLTTEEMMELVGKARAGHELSETDLGNSGSPPSSVAGGSVEPAPPVLAGAGSIPPPAAPSESPAPSARSPHPTRTSPAAPFAAARTLAQGTPQTLPREMTDPAMGDAFHLTRAGAGSRAPSAGGRERSS